MSEIVNSMSRLQWSHSFIGDNYRLCIFYFLVLFFFSHRCFPTVPKDPATFQWQDLRPDRVNQREELINFCKNVLVADISLNGADYLLLIPGFSESRPLWFHKYFRYPRHFRLISNLLQHLTNDRSRLGSYQVPLINEELAHTLFISCCLSHCLLDTLCNL